MPGRVLTLDQILNDPIPKITWDVEGLIGRGRRVVLYGETGAGKTWIAQHMGLSVAAGLPKWLDKFPIPKSRKVLYLDEENPLEDVQRRIGRLARGLNLGKGVPFVVLNRAGTLLTEGGAKALRQWMRLNWDAEYVIADSLRRLMQGNENLQADVSQFWRNVEELSREGITLKILHHMNKPPIEIPGFKPREVRYRASGSTDILAGCDLGIAVGRTEDDDVAHMEGAKGRTAKLPHDFHIQRVDTEEGNPESPVILRLVGKPKPVDYTVPANPVDPASVWNTKITCKE